MTSYAGGLGCNSMYRGLGCDTICRGAGDSEGSNSVTHTYTNPPPCSSLNHRCPTCDSGHLCRYGYQVRTLRCLFRRRILLVSFTITTTQLLLYSSSAQQHFINLLSRMYIYPDLSYVYTLIHSPLPHSPAAAPVAGPSTSE